MKKSISFISIFLAATAAILVVVTPGVRAQQETIVFTAQLQAGAEAPSVNASEAGANGTSVVTLDVMRTGGVITSATAKFEVGVFGLASNSKVILSHIHEGAAGVNGPVRVDSGLSPASPLPAANGFVGFTRSNLTVSPAIAQAIIDNPGGFYFNVHTALSPSGVARGQLARQAAPGGGAAAPTLSQWGALLMMLLVIAACTLFLAGRHTSLAIGGTASAVENASRPIDWKLLVQTTLVVEALITGVLLAAKAGPVDALGAITSGALVAFILHLLIAGRVRR